MYLYSFFSHVGFCFCSLSFLFLGLRARLSWLSALYRYVKCRKLWNTANPDPISYPSPNYRRRSGWTSEGTHGERRRWVRAECGGIWGGCPLSSRLRGLGERRELPPRGPGQSPGRKRILAYFEDHRTLIFVPI